MLFAHTKVELFSWQWVALAVATLVAPLLATVLTQLIFKERPLRELGLALRFSHWHFIGWILMPIITVATLLLSVSLPGMNFLSGKVVDEFMTHPDMMDGVTRNAASRMVDLVDRLPLLDSSSLLLLIFVGALLIGATVASLFTTCMETGWRGYLLRQLEGLPFLEACLWSGISWGLSLVPLVLMGFFYGNHNVLGMPMIVLFCTLLTPLLVYVRVKSATLWSSATMVATLLLCLPVFHLYVIGYDALYTSLTGLSGIAVLLFVDVALFFCDSYITKERIMSSPLRFLSRHTRAWEREEAMQDRPSQDRL